MTLNKHHISILALCIYVVTICILCFIKPASLPDTPIELWGIGIDKIVHFIMFSPFPTLTYLALSTNKKFSILIFIAGCAFALGTESIQGLTDYRSFDLADLATDILGLTFGSAATILYSRLTKRPHNDQ